MKKYKVNVNGTVYEVEIEEMSASQAASVASAPAAAPAAPAASGEGEAVTAPMPGTILSVNVNTGDSVKKGQVLMILEAMKMENEIMASCDGVVTSVSVTKGTAVQSGDVLCTIK
ncbi:MAG: biotin/lipoyl-binding protein [Clostridia bacterium]|nr:biotin/lipoyl-binding protein [Clostridia bacterium]